MTNTNKSVSNTATVSEQPNKPVISKEDLAVQKEKKEAEKIAQDQEETSAEAEKERMEKLDRDTQEAQKEAGKEIIPEGGLSKEQEAQLIEEISKTPHDESADVLANEPALKPTLVPVQEKKNQETSNVVPPTTDQTSENVLSTPKAQEVNPQPNLEPQPKSEPVINKQPKSTQEVPETPPATLQQETLKQPILEVTKPIEPSQKTPVTQPLPKTEQAPSQIQQTPTEQIAKTKEPGIIKRMLGGIFGKKEAKDTSKKAAEISETQEKHEGAEDIVAEPPSETDQNKSTPSPEKK